MKLIDANVLLYAVDERATHHRASRTWLERALGGAEPVAFAWTVLLAFLRLTTSDRLADEPLTVEQAAGIVESWLGAPASVVVEPTRRHLSILHGLLDTSGTAGNLVNDAHLAALALEHGAEIVSFDRDFARFAGVRAVVP